MVSIYCFGGDMKKALLISIALSHVSPMIDKAYLSVSKAKQSWQSLNKGKLSKKSRRGK